MSEFIDTIKKWRRMCDYYSAINKDDPCANCPLSGETCGSIWEMEPDSFVNIAEKINDWKELQYPTWGEWFESRGDLASGWSNVTSAAWLYDMFRDVMDKSIPVDIAEKLGIEPKKAKDDTTKEVLPWE